MDETPNTEDHGQATPPAHGEVPAGSWPVPPPMWQGMPGARWPAPAPPVPATTRRWPKIAAAVGVAAGTAVGAAVIAGAATGPSTPGVTTAASSSSGSNSSGTPTPAPGLEPFGGPGHGRMFFGGVGGPGVLHGQFTVNGPNGGYETLQVQNGTVSSLTSTGTNTWSLVVTSADGSPFTYVIDSGTSVDGGETGVSSIASGDTVRVLAVVSNGTATAKQVNDQTVLKNNGQSWMPQPPTPPGSTSSGTSGSSA